MKNQLLAGFGLVCLGGVQTSSAAITLNGSDQWGTPTTPYNGNVVVPGVLSALNGIDVGATAGGFAGVQFDYSLANKKLNLDLTEPAGVFEWRDNLTGTAKFKMRLDGNNKLSLFNASNVETITINGADGAISAGSLSAGTIYGSGISGNTINGSEVNASNVNASTVSSSYVNSGVINLSGTGSGMFLGGNSVFTMDAAGKVVYGALRPLNILNNSAANAAATSGALTVAGGIGAGLDSYFNGLRVGRGGGNSSSNTTVGASALGANTSGVYNTGVGYYSLLSNDAGSYNVAVGSFAMDFSKGSGNVAMGYSALFSYSGAGTYGTGSYNGALGHNTLYYNTTGSYNSATGYQGLLYNTTGYCNTATGAQGLMLNTTGIYNTATGVNSSYSNVGGSYNTGDGSHSLYSNSSGSYNAALGYNALYYSTNGSYNTALGSFAGTYQADGGTALTANYGVYLGYNAKGLNNSDSNAIVIGANATGMGANTTVIGNSSALRAYINGGMRVSDSTAVTADVTNNDNVLVVGNGSSGTRRTAMKITRDVGATPGNVTFSGAVFLQPQGDIPMFQP